MNRMTVVALILTALLTMPLGAAQQDQQQQQQEPGLLDKAWTYITVTIPRALTGQLASIYIPQDTVGVGDTFEVEVGSLNTLDEPYSYESDPCYEYGIDMDQPVDFSYDESNLDIVERHDWEYLGGVVGYAYTATFEVTSEPSSTDVTAGIDCQYAYVDFESTSFTFEQDTTDDTSDDDSGDTDTSDTTSPSIVYNAPSTADAGESFSYSITATDDTGVQQITVSGSDSDVRQCSGQSSCSISGTGSRQSAGTWQISAEATDTSGNTDTTTISVNVEETTVDSDGDGVIDSEDEFPNDPECVEDSDGDGFCDNKDECPQTSGEYQGCPDSDGDGVPDNEDEFPDDPECTQDSDGDGVCDANDAYPDDPRFAADSDNDGVPDAADACPGTDTSQGSVDDDGCLTNDSDGDGVIDSVDACPNTYGTRTGNKPGCPTTTDSIINFIDRIVFFAPLR